MSLSTTVPIAASLVGLAVILAWRLQETRRVVTLKKIIIPPIGMATGFCMFLVPGFRVAPSTGRGNAAKSVQRIVSSAKSTKEQRLL
jgi:membrane protein CcdC involved in cytochrome C biogenesis